MWYEFRFYNPNIKDWDMIQSNTLEEIIDIKNFQLKARGDNIGDWIIVKVERILP